MQYVFVLGHDRQPIDPCHPARARQMLRKGEASVFRHHPFTIILKYRTEENSIVHDHQVKIDPGSRVTGIVVLRKGDAKVLWAGEISHRGQAIQEALRSRRAHRRSRRYRKCRYRPARFNNHVKPKGWLPPSLNSRVENVLTWVCRLQRLVPIRSIAIELVRFDTQMMQNPEISGVEYQRGELVGYEVREYLLEKWERKCAYCGADGIPLEIEHIIPRSRGGSNRISNLTLSCHECNQAKGSQTAAEYGHPEVQAYARHPLRDVAAVNSTRWALWRRILGLGLPISSGTGGRTRYNRVHLGLPKAHWVDAACVGETPVLSIPVSLTPLKIRAVGHGCRQVCLMNQFGFPRTFQKKVSWVHGFQTGDMVHAVVPAGKKCGVYLGKVAVRKSGYFNITTTYGVVQGIHHRFCQVVSLSDGYAYLMDNVPSSDT